MNTYTTRFWARCPANQQVIDYTLRISTGEMILVERIRGVVEAIKEGYHEEIADEIQREFGGSQTLTATHHGVDIETIRPHLAHWQKEGQQ
jgi:hypothetical protein